MAKLILSSQRIRSNKSGFKTTLTYRYDVPTQFCETIEIDKKYSASIQSTKKSKYEKAKIEYNKFLDNIAYCINEVNMNLKKLENPPSDLVYWRLEGDCVNAIYNTFSKVKFKDIGVFSLTLKDNVLTWCSLGTMSILFDQEMEDGVIEEVKLRNGVIEEIRIT